MKSISVVPLRGGFGNQLFCWALGKQLELTGNRVYFDRSPELGRGFALEGLVPSEQLVSLSPRVWRVLSSSPRFFNSVPGLSLQIENPTGSPVIQRATSVLNAFWGYWQSLDYFEEASDAVWSDLTCWLDSTTAASASYCAVHVRRGDYVTDVGAATVLGAQPREYYENAISFMKQRGHTKFIVFTDDRAWVKQNLLATGVSLAPVDSAMGDFLGLARASGLIMSNSSFSWWAAFHLDRRNGPVVRPSKWFRSGNLDESRITPSRWHLV